MVNCHLSSAAGGWSLSPFYHGLLGTEASAPPRTDASVPNCPTCGILDRFRTGRKNRYERHCLPQHSSDQALAQPRHGATFLKCAPKHCASPLLPKLETMSLPRTSPAPIALKSVWITSKNRSRRYTHVGIVCRFPL